MFVSRLSFLPAALLWCLCLLCGSRAFSQTFLLDYDTGKVLSGPLGARGSGQTFTPRDAVGAGTATTLALTSFSVWRGDGGTSTSIVSTHTYLVIYDRDPDNAAAVQLGASTNSLSIGLADPNGTKYTWTFNNLLLNAATTYWAVFSSAPVDNNLPETDSNTTLVQMSVQTIADAGQYPGGISLIAGRVPHQAGIRDLRFVATFAPAAPPPSLEATGFEAGTGALLLNATGLDPLKSYVLRRGTEVQAFSETVGLAVTGLTTFQFKDPAPPAGRAFYRLELAP